MSRSGYSDYVEDNWQLICWRGAVASAIRGKRGQAFLKELAAKMDAMPEKILISGELVTEDGDCCAIGVVCKSRGLDVSKVDPEESEEVSKLVGVAEAMVREIEYENDECGWNEKPDSRWRRMRRWVDEQIIKEEL